MAGDILPFGSPNSVGDKPVALGLRPGFFTARAELRFDAASLWRTHSMRWLMHDGLPMGRHRIGTFVALA